jgi:ADP-ribose pyrophosphatase
MVKNNNESEKIPEVLKSEIVYDGFFKIKKDRIRLNSGKEMDYDYMEVGDASAVFLIDKGDAILLRQYRHPIKRIIYDLPAGRINKGETPEAAAARECEEETGFKPKKLVYMGSYNHCPGSVSSVVHLYFCDKAVAGKLNLDEGEEIRLFRLPLTGFMDFMKDKELEPIVPLAYLLAKERTLI